MAKVSKREWKDVTERINKLERSTQEQSYPDQRWNVANSRVGGEENWITHETVSIPLWLLVGFVAFLIFGNGLYGGMIMQDEAFILQNPDATGNTSLFSPFFNDRKGIPLSNSTLKEYSPITTISYRINHFLSGGDAFYFHLTNVLLNSVCSVIVYLMAKEILQDAFSSAWAAFFFAVHPIHTESVDHLSARPELLACIFSVLAFLAYVRAVRSAADVTTPKSSKEPTSSYHSAYYGAAIFFYILASFSSSSGLGTVVLMIIYDAAYSWKLAKQQELERQKKTDTRTGKEDISPIRKGAVTRWLGIGYVSIMLLLHRFVYVQPEQTPSSDIQFLSNPMTGTSGVAWFFSLLYNQFSAVLLLVWPKALSHDYSYGCIPLVESTIDIKVILGLLLIVAFVSGIIFAVKKKNLKLLIAFAWVLLPLLPYTQVFGFTNVLFRERWLYIPSLGFCLLLAMGLRVLYKKHYFSLSLVVCVCVLVLCIYSVHSLQRNPEWRDEYVLQRADLLSCPNNAMLLYNVGAYNENGGKRAEAATYYLKAYETYDKFKMPLWRLAKRALSTGEDGSAYCLRLLEIAEEGEFPTALNDMGAVLLNNHKFEESVDYFLKSIEISKNWSSTVRADSSTNLGVAYLRLKKYQEALEAFQSAINIDDNHGQYHNNIGVLWTLFGDLAKAEGHFTKAVELEGEAGSQKKNLLEVRRKMKNKDHRPQVNYIIVVRSSSAPYLVPGEW
eukprot:TRINITY_DN7952_c0_g1_i1.p1 TRINITY_DN7952_c0_g1~~TRINITY_DN7952_c0_g1_i1.p1  ORF type:complete len:727 (-),score=77.63 TRINITY_DN7952_c0_g1_i1:89-2269(-)